MMAVQVAIKSMPVILHCLQDGSVAFQPNQQFKAIVEDNVIFDNEGFSISGEEFDYNVAYRYKNIPEMKKWLIKQELQSPFQLN